MLSNTEYQVNNKSQPFCVKVVHLVPNFQTLAGHDLGAIRLKPTTTLHFNQPLKNQVFSPALDFLFFAKLRLEMYNI